MIDIIPFKGKNLTGQFNLNLLSRERNIYVMDNHNAALWCWLQEIDFTSKYNLVHIDSHYDTMNSHLEYWIKHIPPNLNKLSINEYLNLQYIEPNIGAKTQIMSYDNYIPIFDKLYSENINKYYFFTNDVGIWEYDLKPVEHFCLKSILNRFESIIDEGDNSEQKWIFNLDLDYFFMNLDSCDETIQFVSFEAIEKIIKTIKKYLNDKVIVFTIALSPDSDCCGSWDNSLKVMNIVSKIIDIDFNLEKFK